MPEHITNAQLLAEIRALRNEVRAMDDSIADVEWQLGTLNETVHNGLEELAINEHPDESDDSRRTD
jgi:hypothetical protein